VRYEDAGEDGGIAAVGALRVAVSRRKGKRGEEARLLALVPVGPGSRTSMLALWGDVKLLDVLLVRYGANGRERLNRVYASPDSAILERR